MGPNPQSQVRWGLGVSLAAAAIVAVLALVPDPLFRNRAFATSLDNVEGIAAGTPVYFRGASVGEVRDVALDPATRNFGIDLSIAKSWRPSGCDYVAVSAANPFTAPRIDLVSLERPAGACRVALASAGCETVAAVREGGRSPLPGCRRSPDLIQTAAAAVAQAAGVARTANQMATRLQTMIQGSGGARGAGSAIDMAALARDATGTVAALNSLSTSLGRSLEPGRGDIALTLANVRRLSGNASTLDMAAVNGIIRDTNTMIAQNQENVAAMLADTRGATAQTRTMLEGLSASMVQTSANLALVSEHMGELTERMSGDPTFALRGTRYVDPPAPGARP